MVWSGIYRRIYSWVVVYSMDGENRSVAISARSGGRFIIFDLFLKDSKIEPYDAALFAITMILYTKTGKSYSFGEIESLLKKEGFTRLKKINIGYGSSVIEARKI